MIEPITDVEIAEIAKTRKGFTFREDIWYEVKSKRNIPLNSRHTWRDCLFARVVDRGTGLNEEGQCRVDYYASMDLKSISTGYDEFPTKYNGYLIHDVWGIAVNEHALYLEPYVRDNLYNDD
jgi:hypothetical protein